MAGNRISRKITRILAYTGGVIVVLLVAFHFWFVNHAEELLEGLVDAQSNGKVKLKVRKFKFNWFSHKMELQNAVLYTTDSLNSPVTYRFEIPRLKVQVKAVLPIIFEKKILIDSLHLIDPGISVTRLRVRDSTATRDTALSIPQEMGRVYHSIQDALQVLKVERFQITNGKFSLIDKTNPDEIPVRITNLNFQLENLRVDSTDIGSDQKILFSDNVALQTTHQDILFPDGRHRLSFANFRVNLQNKLAEFDSCTITATKGDSSKSSFRIFFDKLRMTNIDFDTLYRAEVIKADSVYCINPRFSLDVDIQKNDGPVPKPPQLNELIQQLTGDLQVGFVVVQNGAFDIKTQRNGRPSSFTSDHNNFELQGLQIRKDAPRPLIVERFAMAIRNYENFLRDSTYAISFDSILLNNNRISLSNFAYREYRNGRMINSLVMPQFELYGLSWDYLIFNRQLKAERASLYSPVINYDFAQSNDDNAKDVFGTLGNIGKILQLNNLNIIDGQVNLLFKNKAKLTLENTTMFILGEQLVASQKITGIRRSVDMLNFKKARFSMGDLTAEMSNVHFSGVDNKMKAEKIRVAQKGLLDIDANNVAIRSMVLDEKVEHITVNDISWDRANINLSSLPAQNGDKGPKLELVNIRGAKTNLNVRDDKHSLTVNLNTLAASRFTNLSSHLQLEQFSASGNDLVYTTAGKELKIGKLQLADKSRSALSAVTYTRKSTEDSSSVQIPSVTIYPDVNAALAGHFTSQELIIQQPQIQITHRRKESGTGPAEVLPELNIGKLTIEQPLVHVRTVSDKGISTIDWNGGLNNNKIELTDISSIGETKDEKRKANTVSASSMKFDIDHFNFTNAKGRSFNAGDGKIDASLGYIELQKNETGGWDWQGRIATLLASNFVMDSLGKHDGKLTIRTAALHDLSVSSSLLISPRELVSHNKEFRVEKITGSFYSQKTQLNWFNASYDKRSRLFNLDSFAFRPTLPQDSFVASHPYQSDYLTLRTGNLHVGPFDLESYTRDTILDLGVVSINNARLTNFRDKRIPRKPGTVTLLPAHILQEIPVHLLIDTLRVNDSHVDYEEVNDKNGKAGKIAVARLNGNITHLRNYDLGPTDSLVVRASAYLENKIYTRLHVRESYTDSLGGFLMTGHMGAADLRILNPVLGSLASVHIKSGQLDTMLMRVSGREYQAYGEMKLYYHDLKVKVIGADENRKSFMSGIFTFFANTLIKNKNDEKVSRIYFRRLRDRSAINYLVKIALSGFASSIGVKKNKKMLRKNAAEIRQHPLPPIED